MFNMFSFETTSHAKLFRKIKFTETLLIMTDIRVEKNLELPKLKHVALAGVIAEKIWHSPDNNWAFNCISKLVKAVPEGITLIEKMDKFEAVATAAEKTSLLTQWRGNLPEWFDATVKELHDSFDKSLVDLGYVKSEVTARVIPETPKPVTTSKTIKNLSMEEKKKAWGQVQDGMLKMMTKQMETSTKEKPPVFILELLSESFDFEFFLEKEAEEKAGKSFTLGTKLLEKVEALAKTDKFKDIPGLRTELDKLAVKLMAGETSAPVKVPTTTVAPITPVDTIPGASIAPVTTKVMSSSVQVLIRDEVIKEFFTPKQLKKLPGEIKDLFNVVMTNEQIAECFNTGKGNVHVAIEMMVPVVIKSFKAKENGEMVAKLGQAGVWNNVLITEKALGETEAPTTSVVSNMNQALQSVVDQSMAAKRNIKPIITGS